MAYEHLLHDFIDGSLEYGDEIALFAELHINEELRRELKMLLAMRQAAANDTRAYTPAPGSEEAIFNRLGFGSSQSEPVPFAPRYLTQGIIGGMVGAVLMLLLVIGSDHRAFTHLEENTANRAGSMAVGRTGMVHPEVPAAGTAAAEAPAGTGIASLMPALATVYGGTLRAAGDRPTSLSIPPTVRTAHSSSAFIASSDRAAAGTRARRASDADAPAALSIPVTAPALRSSAPAVETHDITSHRGSMGEPLQNRNDNSTDEAPRDIAGIVVEYHNRHSINSRPVPQEIVPHSTPLLRDKSLGVYYQLNEDQAVGIEAGQEDFLQIYRETLPNGDVIEHQQNPLLVWGGASYRQTLFASGNVKPYIQGLLGATGQGPFGRLTAGAGYMLTPQLRVFAGGEVGALAYRFAGSWFVAPRYGFTYGISMGF